MCAHAPYMEKLETWSLEERMWRWCLLSFLVGKAWVFLPTASLLMGGIAGLGKITIMGPLSFKAHWLSEISVLGACHWGRNLKSWVTKCKGPSLLREKLRVMICLLIVCGCAGCGVYGKTVLALYLLWCGFFSFAQYTGVTGLLSGFLSDGIVLYEAEVLVCPCEEMSTGASYEASLNWNLSDSFLMRENLFLFWKVSKLRTLAIQNHLV